jgi:hypothetical protein
VFVGQGHYALDPAAIASNPPADLSIERIADVAGVLSAAIG